MKSAWTAALFVTTPPGPWLPRCKIPIAAARARVAIGAGCFSVNCAACETYIARLWIGRP